LDDLNDLIIFAAVVSHGGFTAAALALGVPKSKVSRRVAALETRLGVRLLQRSTRAVHVTDIGAAFYERCEAARVEVAEAFEVADRAGERPAGRLRVCSPVGVAHIYLAELLPKFLQREPLVQLELDLTNRPVDVIAEGYDVAFRIRSNIEDSSLITRAFGVSEQLLVASPTFLSAHGLPASPAQLQGTTGIGPAGIRGERSLWRLNGPDGSPVQIAYTPRLVTDDVHLMTQAALSGLAVAQLPLQLCAQHVRDGKLIRLLPDHSLPTHRLHVVFPSRRNLIPAVRAFIDFLGSELLPIVKGNNA